MPALTALCQYPDIDSFFSVYVFPILLLDALIVNHYLNTLNFCIFITHK